MSFEKELTNFLTSKVGEKYVAMNIVRMKLKLEDDEIIDQSIVSFQLNLNNGKTIENSYFNNLAQEISKHKDITLGFIDRNLDVIDWDTLSICQILPEWFILKHKDNIPKWGFILEFQELSKESMNKLDEIIDDSCTCDTNSLCDNCQDQQIHTEDEYESDVDNDYNYEYHGHENILW